MLQFRRPRCSQVSHNLLVTRALQLLAARTGLEPVHRLGDLAALTWANFDLARSELHLITRKRGKPLTIPLATPLREHILNHLSANDVPDAPVHPAAFATLKKDQRVRHLSAEFGGLLAAAGLRAELPHQSRGIGLRCPVWYT